MPKNISSLGLTLNKRQQKSIHGGSLYLCPKFEYADCDPNPNPNTHAPNYDPCTYCINL